MSAEGRQSRSLWLAATLSGLTLVLLAYWAFGPPELAPWRIFNDTLGGNMGGRAKQAALAKRTEAQQQAMRRRWQHQADVSYLDKPSLPVMVQSFFLVSISRQADLKREKDLEEQRWAEDLQAPDSRIFPATGAERAFTRFMGIDALAAAVLALALLLWRRQNAPARQLALALSLFALALACFLVNGQARLRGGLFVWPSWSRLVSDVVATLAFGLSLLGFEKFFSSFPVQLEDWQIIHTQLRWRGRPLVVAPVTRPWYLGGRENLVSLAPKIVKLILGILLAGTVLSTLPYLLHDIRFSLETVPDGTVKSLDEKIGFGSLAAGFFAGFLALALFVAFGWLLAVSLTAKLRAGREQCTEEERRQTDWLFAGGLVTALMLAVFSVGLVLLLVYMAWGDSEWMRLYGGSMTMMFFPTGWAVMLLALAGAVFLSKSFGPRPLLKRTMLVAAAGVLMSLLLAIIQHLVTAKIFSHSATTIQNTLSTVMAGGIAVFSLGFFRVRMERGIDGFLNRFMPATVIADGKRRDATVVFSDLGGYTALSAMDETQALHVAGHFQKVAAEVARRHDGRIVKTIGDAVMWVFATPAEAFAAALELPGEFKWAAEADKLTVLPVNSGVHFGSVVEAPGGDVYGAAVNLAARLQGVAKDGTVVASSEAMLEVTGGVRFEPLGKLELKNVSVPVACFRVSAA